MGFGRKVGRIWLVMRNRHWVSNQESTQEQLQQNRMGWVLDKLFYKNQANTQKWLTFVFGLTGWEPVFFFFLKYLFIYYFWLHWLGLCCCSQTFSSCSEQGLLSRCCVWASRYGGFSCCGAQAIECKGPVFVEHRLNQHVASSRMRDWTRVPCTGRWILNYWSTREVLKPTFELPLN